MSISSYDRAQRLAQSYLFKGFETGNVYGYTRVSTIKQSKNGVSMDDQKEHVQAYCTIHSLPEPEIIEEPAVSGTTMDRPKLNQLLEKIKPGDTIIVSSLSRLARNTKDFLNFVDEMKTKYIRIICLKEKIDLQYENGELSSTAVMMLSMLASFSQFEADQTRERTQSAMDKLVRDGTLRHKPHFGEKYELKEGMKVIVPVAEEQQVIDYLQMHIMRDKNISIGKLTNLLNEQIRSGLLKYRKKKKVARTQVANIVKYNQLRDYSIIVSDPITTTSTSTSATSTPMGPSGIS